MGCEAGMKQVKWVRGRYKADKRGARQVQARYKGCEAGKKQVKEVQSRYKAGKRGARQLRGR